MSRRFLSFVVNFALAAAQLSSSSLESHVDSLALSSSFNPIKEAYWTGYPHHRRTPFAVSPDGKTAYLAYLDSSETGVHVQGVDPTTFAAVGDAVTVSGVKEAGGLVAHNDGFALLTNEPISGEADGVAIAVLYRYTGGKQSWKTFLGGPGVDGDGKMASPDINGDLVFSEAAGYYAAYIVVTAYEGSASGHFGDAIRYVNTDGKLENIAGASSSWGCSHNTGIAFEAADEAPFASLCAEDQGAIWLNTKTQGMGNNGVKVSNEHVINGGSNEAMGGMSGSYSQMARFQDAKSYIFAWVSRGAVDLTLNDWMGQGYTKSANRTNNRNVAIALFSDKATLVGEQATSEVGAASGDDQLNWVTSGANDCSNAHAATFDASRALITWEEISSPSCPFDAMGCAGTFAGTKFQMVDSAGKKVGDVLNSDNVYVAGDMVTMNDGRICWPYVSMEWSLAGPTQGTPTSKMSFACMSGGAGSGNDSGSSDPAPSSTKVAETDAGSSPTTGVPSVPSATEDPITTEIVPQPANPSTTAAASPSAGEGSDVPVIPPSATEDPITTEIVPQPANPSQTAGAGDEESEAPQVPPSATQEPITTEIVPQPANPSSQAPPATLSTVVAPAPSSGEAAPTATEQPTRTRGPNPSRTRRPQRPGRPQTTCQTRVENQNVVTEWETVWVTATAYS